MLRNVVKPKLPRMELVRELREIVEVVFFINKSVRSFSVVGFPILVSTFLARGFVNGFLVPYGITYIVEGLREYMEGNGELSKLFNGVAFFGLSGVVFGSTEVALMLYFEKLSHGIISLKERILMSANNNTDNKENLVGIVANDVDFVVWNMNGVLTTLLPNIFTGITALITVYSLGQAVLPLLVASLTPYLMYTELYLKKIMRVRAFEREAYSYSIVLIRDYIYENRRLDDLYRVLKKWKFYVDRIMWYDRLFFASSLATTFGSTALISYVVWLEAVRKKISLGGVAGIISASLTSHMSVMNTMWAICIQGQVTATFLRLKNTVDATNNKRV
ncbi:MAG: hypothetical protein QW123_05150 [Desulfurococcaceae archaeon]